MKTLETKINELISLNNYGDKELGSLLRNLSNKFLKKNYLKEFYFIDSIGMEVQDVRDLIESNNYVGNKDAVLAVIQSLDGYYRIVYYYGENKNITIVSGTMDIDIVFDAVRRVFMSFKDARIDPFKIQIYIPKSAEFTGKFRNIYINTFI